MVLTLKELDMISTGLFVYGVTLEQEGGKKSSMYEEYGHSAKQIEHLWNKVFKEENRRNEAELVIQESTL